MPDQHRIKFRLACLVMATLTGLLGLVIIYHYATFERPLERFAIVIDAGSTQTRSSLYELRLNASKLDHLWPARDQSASDEDQTALPLSALVQVRQVSTCVNGGPLTGLQSIHDARQLISGCLRKFALHIMKLNFENSLSLQDQQVAEDQLELMNAEEIGRRLASLDRRVNSVTRLYLGATAGMRALRGINSTAASQKLRWVSEALGESNEYLGQAANDMDMPYMNQAYVDVISGRDEATFGWISMNFVIDRLELELAKPASRAQRPAGPRTVGTLELGGASAQQAFEVGSLGHNASSLDGGLKVTKLDLFNSAHRLATRSDLCMGMSQAILRADYVLLRDYYERRRLAQPDVADTPKQDDYELELENPCLQNKVRRSLVNPADPEDILSLPCLIASERDPDSKSFRLFVREHSVIRFVGTGNVDQCDSLLAKLVQPAECSRYFSLCPRSKNSRAPPAHQAFVTISGYNKALKVLDLHRDTQSGHQGELEQVIADRLGGYPIKHSEFRQKSRDFCQTDVSELPVKYPQMNQKFYPVNCLQLVYINKLLVEFYNFAPESSWSQIKFLLFAAKEEEEESSRVAGSERSAKSDIGWTLGLLLNATSEQLADYYASRGSHSTRSEPEAGGIFYHHGATVAFVVRASLLLILACCLISICLLLFGAIIGRKRQAGLYLNNEYTGA